LQQRIDSILNQTYQDFELIILDDCSTDNSKEIIEQYNNHPKVAHIIYNDNNSGSTFKQWNKGVECAKGEYVWIAESDDVADIHFLDTLVPQLTDENINIAYCQSNRMSSEGLIVGTWLDHTNDLDSSLFQTNFCMKGTVFIEKYLLYKNVIPNASAVVFRKSAFYKVGKADISVDKCADWLLWLKMLVIGDVYYFSEPLNNFRFHTESVIAKVITSSSSIQVIEYNYIMLKGFDKFLRKNHSKTNQTLREKNNQMIKRKLETYSQCYFNSSNKAVRWRKIFPSIKFLTKYWIILAPAVRKYKKNLKTTFHAPK